MAGGNEMAEEGNGDNPPASSSICTLVAGANDIIRFALVNTHTKKVDVPNNVLFNPNTLQFFTLAGNDIHIWDASEGKHVHSFWNIFEKSGKAENIECMCFDTRRRKIIAGSEGGHVFVFNSVSGVSMKGIKAHHSAVVSVHYADACRCIVSTGSDRRVCIHDESGSDQLYLLRAVSNLHLRGIECCAFSESLSQIATGSTSGGLKMIDFERLQLRSDCVLQKSSPSSLTNGESGGGNITALEFAPNCRPLLISLDTDGLICVWRVQLKERVSGSDGIQAPLLSFYVQDQQTGLLIRTCFTAIALCSLLPAKETPASSSSPSITPESKTEPIDSLVPDVQEDNGTVADSSSSALTAASLMLKNDKKLKVDVNEIENKNDISIVS
jgi:WD40 repeat protein